VKKSRMIKENLYVVVGNHFWFFLKKKSLGFILPYNFIFIFLVDF